MLTRAAVLSGGLCALTLALAACGPSSSSATGLLQPLRIETQAGQVHKFDVELALTDAERAKGLMFRKSMPNDRGMLFEFSDEAERAFWMKNTYISLDILYIDAKGKVVSISRNAQPFNETPLPSNAPAKGVLELNGGLSERLGIQPGDTVRHSFFGNEK